MSSTGFSNLPVMALFEFPPGRALVYVVSGGTCWLVTSMFQAQVLPPVLVEIGREGLMLIQSSWSSPAPLGKEQCGNTAGQ